MMIRSVNTVERKAWAPLTPQPEVEAMRAQEGCESEATEVREV